MITTNIMSDQNQNKIEFQLNEIVFARCRNQPFSPARILKIIEQPKIFEVFFINDKTTAYVKKQDIIQFNQNTIKSQKKILSAKVNQLKIQKQIVIKIFRAIRQAQSEYNYKKTGRQQIQVCKQSVQENNDKIMAQRQKQPTLYEMFDKIKQLKKRQKTYQIDIRIPQKRMMQNKQDKQIVSIDISKERQDIKDRQLSKQIINVDNQRKRVINQKQIIKQMKNLEDVIKYMDNSNEHQNQQNIQDSSSIVINIVQINQNENRQDQMIQKVDEIKVQIPSISLENNISQQKDGELNAKIQLKSENILIQQVSNEIISIRQGQIQVLLPIKQQQQRQQIVKIQQLNKIQSIQADNKIIQYIQQVCQISRSQAILFKQQLQQINNKKQIQFIHSSINQQNNLIMKNQQSISNQPKQQINQVQSQQLQAQPPFQQDHSLEIISEDQLYQQLQILCKKARVASQKQDQNNQSQQMNLNIQLIHNQDSPKIKTPELSQIQPQQQYSQQSIRALKSSSDLNKISQFNQKIQSINHQQKSQKSREQIDEREEREEIQEIDEREEIEEREEISEEAIQNMSDGYVSQQNIQLQQQNIHPQQQNRQPSQQQNRQPSQQQNRQASQQQNRVGSQRSRQPHRYSIALAQFSSHQSHKSYEAQEPYRIKYGQHKQCSNRQQISSCHLESIQLNEDKIHDSWQLNNQFIQSDKQKDQIGQKQQNLSVVVNIQKSQQREQCDRMDIQQNIQQYQPSQYHQQIPIQYKQQNHQYIPISGKQQNHQYIPIQDKQQNHESYSNPLYEVLHKKVDCDIEIKQLQENTLKIFNCQNYQDIIISIKIVQKYLKQISYQILFKCLNIYFDQIFIYFENKYENKQLLLSITQRQILITLLMSNIFTASDYDGHDLYGKIKKLIYIYENGKKQRINNYKAEYLMIKPRLNYYQYQLNSNKNQNIRYNNMLRLLSKA